MQIDTTMRYRLAPARIGVTEKLGNGNFGEDAEKRGCSCVVGRNVNWCKTVWTCLGKKKKMKLELP